MHGGVLYSPSLEAQRTPETTVNSTIPTGVAAGETGAAFTAFAATTAGAALGTPDAGSGDDEVTDKEVTDKELQKRGLMGTVP